MSIGHKTKRTGIMTLKGIAAIVLFALSIIGVTSCEHWEIEDPGPLRRSQKDVAVTNFDRLTMGSALRVHVMQGDFYSVHIEGDQRNIDDLHVYRRGHELVAEFSTRRNRTHETTITIMMPELRGVNFSGASRATVSGFDVPDQDSFDLHLSGASTAIVEVDAEDMRLTLSGSSTLHLKGSSEVAAAILSGASALQAFDFSTSVFSVQASGASAARICVTNVLYATATGASRIVYRGRPEVQEHTSGASSVSED